jgi:Zn-dependent peptidase ImmA (M78 family)
MPKERFLAESGVRNAPGGAIEWPDNTIEDLARHYGVSREAVVRRLITFARTTDGFYRRKRAQYAAEHHARKAAERERHRIWGSGEIRHWTRLSTTGGLSFARS